MAGTKVVLALDWTPNANHAGFFVAHARGYYRDAGLDVAFDSPHTDGYKTTPAQKVLSGGAHLAICPSETIISNACQAHMDGAAGPALRAVAAVLQQDTSAIVTLADSGIERPKQLDGKRYASYGARYEGRIVQKMIRNDGGTGEFVEDTSAGMLGAWEALQGGGADATWVFMGWEGALAARKGLRLNAFTLDDYQIPYGYSPVLAACRGDIECSEQAPHLRAFLAASARGWADVVSDPKASAAAATAAIAELFPSLPEPIAEADMAAGAAVVAEHAGGTGWGRMQSERWETFLSWLSDAGLLTTKRQSRGPQSESTASLDDLRAGDAGDTIPRGSIEAAALFTNDLLPASEG